MKYGWRVTKTGSPAAAGNYVASVRTGNLLYLAGKGPRPVGGVRPKGKLGREFTVEGRFGQIRDTAGRLTG